MPGRLQEPKTNPPYRGLTGEYVKQAELPCNPERLDGTKLVAAQSRDGSLNNRELAALEPTTYVIVIALLTSDKVRGTGLFS